MWFSQQPGHNSVAEFSLAELTLSKGFILLNSTRRKHNSYRPVDRHGWTKSTPWPTGTNAAQSSAAPILVRNGRSEVGSNRTLIKIYFLSQKPRTRTDTGNRLQRAERGHGSFFIWVSKIWAQPTSGRESIRTPKIEKKMGQKN